MSDERPVEDELEPKAEEPEASSDEQDELESADDQNDELDEDEGAGDEPRASEPEKSKPMAPVRGKGSRGSTGEPARAAVSVEDELPYVDDRVSKIWVGAIVGVFLLILAYGLLFGKSGAFSPPTPSPTPTRSPAPTLSASPVPSASQTALPSITITPGPSTTATPAPSLTPAPSPSAAASPTPAPSS